MSLPLAGDRNGFSGLPDLADRLEKLRAVLHRRATILCWDENGLVAVGKSPGLRSHPNDDSFDRQSLLLAPYDGGRRVYAAGLDIFLLNRLDSATGGIVLLALDEAVAKAVRDAFRLRTVGKTYHAFSLWRRNFRREHWTDRLREVRWGNILRVFAGGDQRAETEVLFRDERLVDSLHLVHLEFHPITGRTHQLRVQCALRGMPILGDRTYGDFGINALAAKRLGIRELQLCGAEISLQYRLRGRTTAFHAHSPDGEPFQNWEKFKVSAPDSAQ